MNVKEIIQRVKSWNPMNTIRELQKANSILQAGILRPFDYFSTGYVYKYPSTMLHLRELYDLAHNSDILSTVHKALRREIFRNGYELAEAKLSDQDTNSEEEVEPSGKEMAETRKLILDFCENVNQNEQDIISVMEELEDDLSIVDNFFCLLAFEYAYDDQGNIVSRYLKELLRNDPVFMGLMINERDELGFDDDEKEILFCPEHRDQLLTAIDRCPICGKECFRACYFHKSGDRAIHYAKWEIIHKSKYRISKRGGVPPLYALEPKIKTLLFMDQYILKLYDKQRPPKGILFVQTPNQDSFEKTWEKIKQKARQDPHSPAVMGVQGASGSGGKSFVEYIDLMKPLPELSFIESRDEMRRVVGAYYGVSPVFQNDVSMSGGLNNEGLQITVTNRAVESGQSLYNKFLLPKILEGLGVEGWSLTLNPSEEQDEIAKLQQQQLSLMNGLQALNIGLEAEYEEDTNQVKVHSGTLSQQQPETNPQNSNPFGNPSSTSPSTNMPSGTSLAATFSSDKSVIVKARSRPPFTKLAEYIKEQVESFVKRYKQRPTEQQLRTIISKINKNLVSNLMLSNNKFFKDTYLKEMTKIEKDLGINILFDKIDQEALGVLSNQDVLNKAYANISSKLTTEINNVITQAYRRPEGLSTEKILKDLKDAVDITDYHAENIARTETSKVSAAARLNSYKKEEDFATALFKWIGPSDHRTTEVSKRIKSLTMDGVPWDQLVNIVKQESAKDFPEWRVDPNFPVSHYQSRHTFVRIAGTNTVERSNNESRPKLPPSGEKINIDFSKEKK